MQHTGRTHYSIAARSKPLPAQNATQRSGVMASESIRASASSRPFGISAAQIPASVQPASVRGVAARAGGAAGSAVGGTVCVLKMTRACGPSDRRVGQAAGVSRLERG
jgi:hypothetical protein